MGTTAQTLWICLLGYIIHLSTGAATPLEGKSAEVPVELTLGSKKASGGVVCSPNSQPWRAAVFFNNTMKCSGALVHPQWVLTAAHCWQPSYTIGLGLQRISSPYGQGIQMLEANFSVQHPYFHKNSSRFTDLMLIKLSKPAVESATVRAIPITSNCPKTGTTCLASGWCRLLGVQYTGDLHCALIRVHSLDTCRVTLGDTYDSTVFCASGGDNRGGCQEDPGEPVVCHGFLQGLVSSEIHPCGPPGMPSIYTNLCKFKYWIDNVIQHN